MLNEAVRELNCVGEMMTTKVFEVRRGRRAPAAETIVSSASEGIGSGHRDRGM